MKRQRSEPGPIYTRGASYRARAEARQREYRAHVLGVPHGKYGHIFDQGAAGMGANLVLGEAHRAAQARQATGKGVAARTFGNMLSSQAMCFNVFAPLVERFDLAAEVLRPFIHGLTSVTAIRIEHTPDPRIFQDQTGLGGVDCDILIEGTTTSGKLVQVVETKFVETEFSRCGFRKPGRAKKGQAVCPDDVPVKSDRRACLYVRNKGYGYWQRSDQFEVLAENAAATQGCPFSGQAWQLWVNLVLAHAEANSRGATDARFAVCTSSNTVLLREGSTLDEFRSLLRRPESVQLIDLESLLEHLGKVAPAELAGWVEWLKARYGGI